MENKAVYVGMSKNVLKRIRNNHCKGNVHVSFLRQTIAKLMGMTVKRIKKENKAPRFIIDSPINGEPRISDYLQQGEWQFIPCETEEEAREFEYFVIEQIKPPYNRSYNEDKKEFYIQKFHDLQNCPRLKYDQISRTAKIPGVYIHYNRQITKDL